MTEGKRRGTDRLYFDLVGKIKELFQQHLYRYVYMGTKVEEHFAVAILIIEGGNKRFLGVI